MKLAVNELCFGCGRKNPIGLKLEFHFEGDDYVTVFEVSPEHQGWAGIVHGGLLATAMDETMARLLWEKEIEAITGRLEIRYRKPAKIGDRLEIRARIARRRSPVVETVAEARGAGGEVVAEATAVSMEVAE